MQPDQYNFIVGLLFAIQANTSQYAWVRVVSNILSLLFITLSIVQSF